MPHMTADSFSFRNVFVRNGESRFARPVAAITGYAMALRDRTVSAFAARGAVAAPRLREDRDMDVRALEEDLAHASDHGHVERIQRAFDRREAEGMHIGTWR